jgi:hypothetical protein
MSHEHVYDSQIVQNCRHLKFKEWRDMGAIKHSRFSKLPSSVSMQVLNHSTTEHRTLCSKWGSFIIQQYISVCFALRHHIFHVSPNRLLFQHFTPKLQHATSKAPRSLRIGPMLVRHFWLGMTKGINSSNFDMKSPNTSQQNKPRTPLK